MKTGRNILFSAILLVISVAICVAAGEIFLRIKNSSMKNYDIEMWRYAKELKEPDPDPDLSYDHVRSKSAVLQGVAVRLNEIGLRGDSLRPVPPGGRRILFLGGSITFGWGVSEEDTVEVQVQNRLRDATVVAQVLNGGVCNYDTVRYVSRFFKELRDVNPTDIVVHYFLRDAEDLTPDTANFILRNSELAVTLWIAYHRIFDRSGEASLIEHYRKVYDPTSPGFKRMKDKLGELARYAKEHDIKLFLAMTPDVHHLVDYKFGFVHEAMQQISAEYGYKFIDLLPILQTPTQQDLYTIPGDPHPNALAHRLMATAILPALLGRQARGGQAMTQ
jgi:lysophospholipase L1-like esterase